MAVLEDAMGRSLRLLNRFAGSDLAKRLKLHEPAEKLLYQGTKLGFQVAERAAQAARPVTKLLKPERMREGEAPRPELFDLTLSDEQEMMQDTVRRFAEATLRKAARDADGACAAPEKLLADAQELGLVHMAIPEALGGYGQERSPVTNAIVAEELARGDMGLAWAILAPQAVVTALVDHGSAGQQGRWLPSFVDRPTLGAALAMVEPRPLFDPFRPETRASVRGAGYVLDGVKSMVPLGDAAELWLVSAWLDGEGPRVFLVERGTPGVRLEAEPAMGLRAAATSRLVLEDVRVGRDALLGEDPTAFDLGALVDRARVAWAAMVVGAAQGVVEYVIPYVKERVAFGEPVAHRQAVAFMIASMATEVEGLRLMTWRAASLAEQGRDTRRAATLAHVQAAEHGPRIGSDGIQLLGGAGFITDHPVELWYRNLRAAGVMEGGLLV